MNWFAGYLAAFFLLVIGETKAQTAGYTLPAGTPACVETKLKGFGDALIANAVYCYEQCTKDKVPTPTEAKALFDNLDTSGLKTCSGFQAEIMNGICNTNLTSCCPWVIPAFVEVMECIAQDGLRATPEPCKLSCTQAKTTRRDLQSNGHDRLAAPRNRELFIDVGDGSVVQPSNDALLKDCVSYLDNGSGQMVSADALVDKLANSNMIGCLAGTTLKVVAEEVAYEEYREKTFIDMDWLIPSTGLTLGAAIGIQLAVLGLLCFCCAGFCHRRAATAGSSSGSAKKEKEKEVDSGKEAEQDDVPGDEEDED